MAMEDEDLAQRPYRKCFPQNTSVLEVVVDESVDFREALVVQAGQAAALDDVRGAVEGRGHHAIPIVAHWRSIRKGQLRGNHRPAETHTGESRVLGERIHLDGHVLGARNLVDGFRGVCNPFKRGEAVEEGEKQ